MSENLYHTLVYHPRFTQGLDYCKNTIMTDDASAFSVMRSAAELS